MNFSNTLFNKHGELHHKHKLQHIRCAIVPPHIPKTSETQVLHYENVFQICSMLNVSIQNVFYSWYCKKISKGKYFPLLYFFFHPSDSTRFLFETH